MSKAVGTPEERLAAKRRRKEDGKDVYCAWCGKEIGDWIDCNCHASNWKADREMVEGDL